MTLGVVCQECILSTEERTHSGEVEARPELKGGANVAGAMAVAVGRVVILLAFLRCCLQQMPL